MHRTKPVYALTVVADECGQSDEDEMEEVAVIPALSWHSQAFGTEASATFTTANGSDMVVEVHHYLSLVSGRMSLHTKLVKMN